jgi:alpha-tubulin suppressor-like RCC1 family protein
MPKAAKAWPALLAALFMAACGNPLFNMVKDTVLKNTADVSSLEIRAGSAVLALSPGFSPNILEYRALTNRNSASISVQAVLADAEASLSIEANGASAAPGSEIALVAGDNIIEIKVLSASGLLEKNYSIKVSKGLIKQLGGGSMYNFALQGDGNLWMWGRNWGNLGDGTFTDRAAPTWISGISDVSIVSSMDHHSMALKADGSVWTWGGNWDGVLGNGTYDVRNVPGQVTLLPKAIAVAAGRSHSLAVTDDNIVYAWGSNESGQLGDNTTVSRNTPKRVEGGLTQVVAVAAGDSFSLALKQDGTVWAWGANWAGQLGDNTSTFAGDQRSLLPVQVAGIGGAGLLGDVRAIAAGCHHALALKADGTLLSWGLNDDGQLGNNSTLRVNAPVQVLGPNGIGFLTGVESITASWYHNAALKGDGNVYVWGSNWCGEMGNGSIKPQLVPLLVSSLLPAVKIGSGAQSVMISTRDDEIYWWGTNYFNETAIARTPVQVLQDNGGSTGPLTGALDIAAGGGHALVRKTDQTAWSFGDDYKGQLGFDSATDVSAAKKITFTGVQNIAAIAAGERFSLALKTDGSIWSFGLNDTSQLGNGSWSNSTTPSGVTMTLGSAIEIAAGNYHGLAIKTDGTLWAWGLNDRGQAGKPVATDIVLPVPAQVSGFTNASKISAGSNHSLVLKGDGTVWAFGYNGDGQLGNGNRTDSAIPVQVQGEGGLGFLTGVSAVACGSQHNLALKIDGTVASWGSNNYGALGDRMNSGWSSAVPVAVYGLSGITAVAAGPNYGLALKSDRTVWAWGQNNFGQLGNGTALDSNFPVKVPSLSDIASIHAGDSFAFAVKTDGTVWAWGNGEFGQLGNGRIAFQYSPTLLNWP